MPDYVGEAAVSVTGGTLVSIPEAEIVRANDPNSAPASVLADAKTGISSIVKASEPAGLRAVIVNFIDGTSTANGQRIQSVTLNGNPAVTNLDLFKETGVAKKEHVVKLVYTSTGGSTTVGFSASVGTTGPIAAIDFISADSPDVVTPPVITPPPPPPVTKALSNPRQSSDVNGQILDFDYNFDAVSYGRGSPASPVWESTNPTSPVTVSPADRTQRLTYLTADTDVPVFVRPLDGTAAVTATFHTGQAATPPPPSTGLLQASVYESDGRDETTWAGVINHDVSCRMAYFPFYEFGQTASQAVTGAFVGGGWGAWLGARSDRKVILSIWPQGTTFDAFNQTWVSDQMVAATNTIVGFASTYGFSTDQVIYRYCFEWNLYLSINYGTAKDAGFVADWQRVHALVQAAHPMKWVFSCAGFWTGVDSNGFAYFDDPARFDPGPGYRDYLGIDFYGDYPAGGSSSAWSNAVLALDKMVAYRDDNNAAHPTQQVQCVIDEWCLTTSGSTGANPTGDDNLWAGNSVAYARTHNFGWMTCFEEAGNLETRGRFEDISNSGGGKAIAAVRREWALVT